MAKRTIKPAAGESQITAGAATSAARLVHRDGSTGRFVIVPDQGSNHRKTSGVFKAQRSDSRFKTIVIDRVSRLGSKKR
jgi:hypothetical protein